MQEYDNNKNNNIRRMPSGSDRPSRSQAQSGQARRPVSRSEHQGTAEGSSRPVRKNTAEGQPRPVRQSASDGQARPMRQSTAEGQPRRRPVNGQSARPTQSGQPKPAGQGGPSNHPRPAAQGGPNSQARRPVSNTTQGASGQPRPANKKTQNTAGSTPKKKNGKNTRNLTPQQAAKKKRKKIILFVSEIFLLLILVGALWAVKKSQLIQYVDIKPDDVHINKEVQQVIDDGTTSMKGYRNIALFGVDSRDKELDKNTRTDVIMIASINQDTKEVKLVSVYRDTWLNMSTDKYGKANAAYAKGGAKQAISMLNMNFDMDITDFVTVGFDAVIHVVDAVGGVEINVTEAEIKDLNNYQISMVGKQTGLNAKGEPNFEATAGVDYTPVTKPGLQTLNGLQATAYSRIRYVGGDGARTERQRTVLTQMAKKAMKLNPGTIDEITNAVFSEIATSLSMQEILSLLADIASYDIGEMSGFPFADHVKMNGRVGSQSVVVPIDLTKNVTLLHEFLFDEQDYTPSETVKECSKRIAAETGISYNGE